MPLLCHDAKLVWQELGVVLGALGCWVAKWTCVCACDCDHSDRTCETSFPCADPEDEKRWLVKRSGQKGTAVLKRDGWNRCQWCWEVIVSSRKKSRGGYFASIVVKLLWCSLEDNTGLIRREAETAFNRGGEESHGCLEWGLYEGYRSNGTWLLSQRESSKAS